MWQIVSLGYLLESFLVNKAIRYDIKGKKYINTLSKYYFSDIGLRNAILNMRQQEESHIMENIIYNELITRGYNVDVGMVEIKSRTRMGNGFVSSLKSILLPTSEAKSIMCNRLCQSLIEKRKYKNPVR